VLIPLRCSTADFIYVAEISVCFGWVYVENPLRMPVIGKETALHFQMKAKCNVSKARSSVMSVMHCDVNTPVFMPVGTQVKGACN
jgi:hypothetical protein